MRLGDDLKTVAIIIVLHRIVVVHLWNSHFVFMKRWISIPIVSLAIQKKKRLEIVSAPKESDANVMLCVQCCRWRMTSVLCFANALPEWGRERESWRAHKSDNSNLTHCKLWVNTGIAHNSMAQNVNFQFQLKFSSTLLKDSCWNIVKHRLSHCMQFYLSTVCSDLWSASHFEVVGVGKSATKIANNCRNTARNLMWLKFWWKYKNKWNAGCWFQIANI